MLNIQSFTFNPFSENTYIVYDDEQRAWLIDPGNSNEQENKIIQRFVEEKNLVLEKILLTHAHIDHIWGLQWAHDIYQVPVYLHETEDEILKLGKLSAQRFGIDFKEFSGEKIFVQENDELKLGEEIFKIYYTPGHSPGHIIYHNAKNKIAFSGDVLFAGSVGRTDLYKGNFNQLIESIHTKLFTLAGETAILSGHGKATTIEQEKLTNPFIK